MKTVSAAEANRQFSKILRAAAGGERITVLSRGKPVAEIGPAGSAEERDAIRAEKTKRRLAFLEEMASRPALGLPRLKRDDFYE
jgi:prevent-host-death family protein